MSYCEIGNYQFSIIEYFKGKIHKDSMLLKSVLLFCQENIAQNDSELIALLIPDVPSEILKDG